MTRRTFPHKMINEKQKATIATTIDRAQYSRVLSLSLSTSQVEETGGEIIFGVLNDPRS